MQIGRNWSTVRTLATAPGECHGGDIQLSFSSDLGVWCSSQVRGLIEVGEISLLPRRTIFLDLFFEPFVTTPLSSRELDLSTLAYVESDLECSSTELGVSNF